MEEISINIKYSPTHDLKKILFTVAQLKNGFYGKNNFLIFIDKTPTNFKKQNNLILSERFLKFLKDEFDWSKLEESYYADLINPIKQTPTTKKLSKFTKKCELKEIDYKKLVVGAKTILAFNNIPRCQINIYPVSEGSQVSFRFIDKTKMEIFARFDSTTTQLIIAISNCILSNIYPKEKWLERSSINDYLFKHSNLGKLIDLNELELNENLEEVPTLITKNSSDIYKAIGFPINHIFKLDEHGEIINNITGLELLTKSEEVILKLLLQNEGHILTFEEISQALWSINLDKKYSLDAIAKVVERLRDKIYQIGIKKDIIFTKRGKGYTLVQ